MARWPSFSSTSTISRSINDSLGHEAGDRVLVEVGRRLGRICRRSDTVARFGGDEFVLLCALRADEDVRLIASRAVRAIGKRFSSEGDDLTVTASVGVIVTADPSSDPGTLLQQADIAMYEAKSAGRDGFRLYDSKLRVRAMAEPRLRRHVAQSDRQEGAVPALPAPLLARRPVLARGRGTRALEAPRARCRPAGRLHPARRGTRVDRQHRHLRFRRGMPATGCCGSKTSRCPTISRWR